MFNTISWHSYWTMLVLLSAVYYLVIFLLYFREDFISSLPGVFRRGPRAMGAFTKAGEQSFVLHDPDFQIPLKETEEGIVYACMDELNAFFEEAKKRKWEKNEMIYSLQLIMKKYPSIKTSGYKQSVSNVLINQCEHICSLHFNAEELGRVWLG